MKFVKGTLALNKEIFVIHIAYLEFKISIYPVWKALITLLLAKKVSIPKRYTNFLDVFFKKSPAMLSNCLDINKHIINLKPKIQLSYWSIYNLAPIELKIFKTCIKANLANGFIWLSKFPIRASIIFI